MLFLFLFFQQTDHVPMAFIIENRTEQKKNIIFRLLSKLTLAIESNGKIHMHIKHWYSMFSILLTISKSVHTAQTYTHTQNKQTTDLF